MSDEELERIGRTMAGALRHFPDKLGLSMDKQGFVPIKDLIFAIQTKDSRDPNNSRYHWLRPHHIIALVETDPKGRYQYSNDLIRATYGHSIDLDLKLPTDNIPEHLYYPTTEEECDIILETGLKPSDRKMVHLSKAYSDAYNAGKVRTETPIILEIDATNAICAGHIIMRAAKTVYLVKEIPREFLKKAEEQEVLEDESSEG